MRARAVAITAIAAVLLALLVGAVRELPGFGDQRGTYEQRRNEKAVASRHVTNLDAFVNFDLRGFDTLGEEFLLFTAVGGLALLLRDTRGRRRETAMPPADGRTVAPRSEGPRALAPFAVGTGAVLGVQTILHGQLTPGGGFQGGAIVGSALATVWIAYGYATWNRISEKDAVEPVEALSAAAFAATGLAAALAGVAFLQNIAPLGGTGATLSGGTIWIVNVAIGIEVAASFLILLAEFIHATRREEPG